MTSKIIEFRYVTFCGDTHFTVPQFDFYFKFLIPRPNKERIIIEGDWSEEDYCIQPG